MSKIKIKKYWATWCGPCKMMTPIIDEVSKSLDIEVESIDIEEDRDIVVQEGIKSIPHFQFSKDDEIVCQHSGSLTKDELLKIIGEM